MKEQGPVNFELTNQPNLHTLEGERNFMPEPGAPEGPGPLSVNPPDSPPESSAERERELSPEEYIRRQSAQAHRFDREIEDAELEHGESLKIERGVKLFQENFGKGVRTIMHASKLDDPEVSEEIENFLYYADRTKKLSEELFNVKYKRVIDDIRRMQEEGDLAGIKKVLPEFSKDIRRHYVSVEAVAPDVPESLEDLAALIMRSESSKWKTGESKELLDNEGNVNKENFLAWVRKRMLEVHEFNSTSTVEFFSSITVKSRWSQVSLFDMVLTGSYFLKKKEDVLLLPPGPKGEGEEENVMTKSRLVRHTDKDYEALRNQVLYEAWLFNISRNSHVEYVKNQFSEKDLAQTINKLYMDNVFTRDNHFEMIMSMPSMKEAADEVLRDGMEIQDKQAHNFKVGQAVRKLLLGYYYIYDYDMLKKLFKDEDSPLFTEEYDEMDSDGTVKRKTKGVNIKGHTNKEYEEDRGKWYENGKLKGDKVTKREFMEFINVFTAPGPQKSEAVISEVRERMVQSIMKDVDLDLDYDEAKYAEAWAFSMTRWTGLGAKNDTGAVGHDAWTKALNAQEYRIRQMAEQRNAMYGNIYNMLGFKRLGLNFFEGVRDESGRTLIEVLQGGEGSDMTLLDTSLKELSTKVRFQQDTMRGFAGNHVLNSFALVEFLIDHNELNFQEMLTFDSMGRPIVNYEKANKIIDGVEKAVRYWCSTWGGTDFSKVVRTWEIETEDETNPDYVSGKKSRNDAVAKEMPILMELFGPEILKIIKRQSEDFMNLELSLRTESGKEKYMKQAKDNSKVWSVQGVGAIDTAFLQNNFRALLWKGMFEYMVKAEIESHRNVYSDEARFNMLKMEAIYAFLRSKHILTDEEIKRLRKDTHTTEFGLMVTEGGSGALLGALLGALKGFKSTTGKLTKV